ncbi:hypothetical protein MHYP_G00047930 [Metynnis hypsauchen]
MIVSDALMRIYSQHHCSKVSRKISAEQQTVRSRLLSKRASLTHAQRVKPWVILSSLTDGAPHILGYTARPGPPDLNTFRSSSLRV